MRAFSANGPNGSSGFLMRRSILFSPHSLTPGGMRCAARLEGPDLRPRRNSQLDVCGSAAFHRQESRASTHLARLGQDTWRGEPSRTAVMRSQRERLAKGRRDRRRVDVRHCGGTFHGSSSVPPQTPFAVARLVRGACPSRPNPPRIGPRWRATGAHFRAYSSSRARPRRVERRAALRPRDWSGRPRVRFLPRHIT